MPALTNAQIMILRLTNAHILTLLHKIIKYLHKQKWDDCCFLQWRCLESTVDLCQACNQLGAPGGTESFL